jgi:uncharacterized membrane protein YkvA (DUF1232 family)
MTPGRRTLAAVLVAVGALIYGISPVDVIPELLTGPLGFADDLAVWVGAGFAIWKLLTGRDPRPGNPRAGGVTPPPTS